MELWRYTSVRYVAARNKPNAGCRLKGTNEWARSPLCPVRFSTRKIASGTLVFSRDYTLNGQGRRLNVNRLEEDGRQILFDHHSRIVSFPIGDTVTFALDETTGTLTVTSSSGASVRWDTVNQRRLTNENEE